MNRSTKIISILFAFMLMSSFSIQISKSVTIPSVYSGFHELQMDTTLMYIDGGKYHKNTSFEFNFNAPVTYNITHSFNAESITFFRMYSRCVRTVPTTGNPRVDIYFLNYSTMVYCYEFTAYVSNPYIMIAYIHTLIPLGSSNYSYVKEDIANRFLCTIFFDYISDVAISYPVFGLQLQGNVTIDGITTIGLTTELLDAILQILPDLIVYIIIPLTIHLKFKSRVFTGLGFFISAFVGFMTTDVIAIPLLLALCGIILLITRKGVNTNE